MLHTVLSQSLFSRLNAKRRKAQLIVLVNGTTDRTVTVAEDFVSRQLRLYPGHEAVAVRVVNIPERGKLNAWNRYVHDISCPESQFLFMMDSDIDIHFPDTISNLLTALENDPVAHVATDTPLKHLSSKSHKTLVDRMSLQQGKVTTSTAAQLCGQLYCIRSATARNLWMPRHLSACEDGFLKWLVCTDCLTEDMRPERIIVPAHAEHTFEAYTSPAALLKNRKRQVLGQTIVHILIDQYLPALPLAARRQLGATLKQLDETDPAWLLRLIAAHLERTRTPWNLYPGLAWGELRRLRNMSLRSQIACLPSSLAAGCLNLAASQMAYASMKRGAVDYWPRAERTKPAHPPAGFIGDLHLAGIPPRKE